MKRAEIVKYEQTSVRITFKTEISKHNVLNGLIYATGLKFIIFWPIDYDEGEDAEISILYKDIINITPLN